MMNVVRLNANAKLNLTLDVTGKENGYHMLDSLVVTVDLSDRIVLKKRKDGRSSVVMHGMGSESIPPEENNALRAAERFSAAFSTTGADITVYKNIPVGAGLGGSSADAAGVLLGMKHLYGVPDMGAVESLADELGSDTKYLLTGGLARMRGRGEIIEHLPEEPEMHFLLLCPKEGVSSRECYGEYDRLQPSYAPCTEEAVRLIRGGMLSWAAQLFSNRLYDAAASLCGAVKEAYAEARAFSPLGAAMTGSGSASFALFETRELAEWAKSRYRGKSRAIVAKSFYPKTNKEIKNPFVLGEDEGTGG